MGIDKAQLLLIASSYLDNPVLTDSCNAYIAFKLKNTSLEKLENIYEMSFNISEEYEKELMNKYMHLITSDLEAYKQAIS